MERRGKSTTIVTGRMSVMQVLVIQKSEKSGKAKVLMPFIQIGGPWVTGKEDRTRMGEIVENLTS